MSYTLRAAVVLSCLLFATPLRADDGGEHHETKFEAKVRLLATPNAPPGAAGKVEVKSECEDGASESELEIEAGGLSDGEYTVVAIRKSDGSAATIGTILMAACHQDEEDDDEEEGGHEDDPEKDGAGKGEDDDDDDEEGEDGADDGDEDCNGKAEGEFELPLDLDPTDIAEIQVLDVNGVAVLAGSFSEASGGCVLKFHGKASLEGSDAAPAADGLATMKFEVKKKKQKSRFTLVGKNVPPNSTLTVQVNGGDVATVVSNRKGRVLVKKLPFADLTIVQEVTLVDVQGNVVASASFNP